MGIAATDAKQALDGLPIEPSGLAGIAELAQDLRKSLKPFDGAGDGEASL